MVEAIDRQLGGRLRQRRLLLGLTQGEVGAAIGVSFQSIQKYESGQNRINAARLAAMAQFLGVSLLYFFAADGGEIESDGRALLFAGKIARLPGPARARVEQLIDAICEATYAALPPEAEG